MMTKQVLSRFILDSQSARLLNERSGIGGFSPLLLKGQRAFADEGREAKSGSNVAGLTTPDVENNGTGFNAQGFTEPGALYT